MALSALLAGLLVQAVTLTLGVPAPVVAAARDYAEAVLEPRTDGTLDRTYLVSYEGGADLKPVEADQADLSVEWYFDGKSALNAAIFWKDISGFITYQLQENIDNS